jgi:hypothetical protein
MQRDDAEIDERGELEAGEGSERAQLDQNVLLVAGGVLGGDGKRVVEFTVVGASEKDRHGGGKASCDGGALRLLDGERLRRGGVGAEPDGATREVPNLNRNFVGAADFHVTKDDLIGED